jgi:hypothetical protein
MSTSSVWQEFSADPRDRAHASLRASDADRELVRRVLADAYAEGRLERDELDERADAAGVARVLGDLPPLIDDLVPAAAASTSTRALEGIPERAVARWERQRREAIWRFVSVSVICWVIWGVIALTNGPHFPWPVFVMLGTGINAARVSFNRDDIVSHEVRRLEKKERKALAVEQIQNRLLGPGQPYWHQQGRGHGRRDWNR